jgi:hypothetical protein
MAMAHGLACEGPHRCFYCGAPCGEGHPAAAHVKGSFTGRPGVAAPGSPWVCPGCVLCLREGAEIELVDGGRRAGQRMRGYSWVVGAGRAVAATKAHLGALRGACLRPPPPPFAIVLSDSGQTHQLYRGVVNHASDPVVVTLEAERIDYRPADLARLLAVAARYCAAAGKPALSEPVSARGAIATIGRCRDGEAIVETWGRAWGTPIGRLCAWLTPNRESCAKEYPADAEDRP